MMDTTLPDTELAMLRAKNDALLADNEALRTDLANARAEIARLAAYVPRHEAVECDGAPCVDAFRHSAESAWIKSPCEA